MILPGDSGLPPLMAYSYRVAIATKTVGFKEVSGLSRQHETLTYQHGLSAWEGERLVKYHIDRPATITLRKATITPDVVFLHVWLETKLELPMTVSLCGPRGVPWVSWRIARALPVKLTAPTFDASSNDVAIDTFEVMASGIRVDAVPFAVAL